MCACMCVFARRPKHESLPSPHTAVNHSFLQGIRSVSTPLSSVSRALPPTRSHARPWKVSRAVRRRGWMGVVVRGGGKRRGGVIRLMPQGLSLGSSASWEKMVREWCIVSTSFKHLRIFYMGFCQSYLR